MTPTGSVMAWKATISPALGVGHRQGARRQPWFTQQDGRRIGKITPSGTITNSVLPGDHTPDQIAAGPDGNVWFSENGADYLGRITPAGMITEFALPAGSIGRALVAGPDGNVWFTNRNRLGRMTPTGTLTEFIVPTQGAGPTGIAVGPDGKIWFTEFDANKDRATVPLS